MCAKIRISGVAFTIVLTVCTECSVSSLSLWLWNNPLEILMARWKPENCSEDHTVYTSITAIVAINCQLRKSFVRSSILIVLPSIHPFKKHLWRTRYFVDQPSVVL